MAAEHLGQEVENQLLRKHHGARLPGHADEPGKDPGAAGNNAQLFPAVFSGQHAYGVDLLVLQEGEGLPLTHHGGREQRRDLRVKIPLQLAAFLLSDLLKIDQADALLLQPAHQRGIDRVPPSVQPGGFLQYGADLLGSGHPGLVVPQISGHQHLVLQ